MKWFFDMDNPVMRTLSVVADLIILNLLTLCCSIPVVTAGAAITAMYDVAIHIIRNEDGSMVKDYFRSFAANFKRSTLLWLLLIAAAALLYFDYLAAAAFVPVLSTVICAMAVMVLVIALYAFALLARYENTLAATLKNAVSLAIGYFPKTLAMAVFFIGFWLLAITFIQYGAPILFMFGLSLPCYVCVLLMNEIFNKLENK